MPFDKKRVDDWMFYFGKRTRSFPVDNAKMSSEIQSCLEQHPPQPGGVRSFFRSFFLFFFLSIAVFFLSLFSLSFFWSLLDNFQGFPESPCGRTLKTLDPHVWTVAAFHSCVGSADHYVRLVPSGYLCLQRWKKKAYPCRQALEDNREISTSLQRCYTACINRAAGLQSCREETGQVFAACRDPIPLPAILFCLHHARSSSPTNILQASFRFAWGFFPAAFLFLASEIFFRTNLA